MIPISGSADMAKAYLRSWIFARSELLVSAMEKTNAPQQSLALSRLLWCISGKAIEVFRVPVFHGVNHPEVCCSASLIFPL
jgi:hypothetical protein